MTALGASEYTQLIATTMERWESKDLVDQIFTRHPTLDLFRSKASSKAGRQLVMNLEAADNKQTDLTDDSGTFDTSVSPDFIGTAVYKWSAPIVTPIRVQWKRLQEQAGKEQIVDLAKAHLENAKKNHQKRLVGLLHADASAVEQGSFLSLDEIVADYAYDDASVTRDVGGFRPDDSDHFWQAYRATIEADPNDGDYVDIRKAFRHMRNELLVATSHTHQVTHIIAGRKVFEEFEDSFDDKVRYVEFGTGQTRFRALMDGDIEVRLDPDCPEDRAYFLDMDAWEVAYLNGNFMKVQPAQEISGTLDFVTPIASVLAVGTQERRASALMIRDYA